MNEYPAAPPPPEDQLQQPGVIPLRPLTIGPIYGGALATMRRYPLATMGIALAVAIFDVLASIPLSLHIGDKFSDVLLRYQLTGQLDSDWMWDVFDGTAIALAVLTVVVTMFSWILLSGVLTVVAGEAIMGRPAPLRKVLSKVWPRTPALLGLTGLYLLIFLGMLLPIALIMAIGAAGGSGFAVLMGLVGIGVMLWLAIRLTLSTPALVLERIGPARAIGRSWELVRGAWWRTFGVLLLAMVIVVVIGLLVELPFRPSGPADDSMLLAGTIVSIVFGAVTQPFLSTVTVLLYVDRRMRREGLGDTLTDPVNA